MRKGLLAVLLVGAWAMSGAVVLAEGKKGDDKDDKKEAKIAIRDDCDANDPAWTPLGGCTLVGGAVTVDEFNLLLFSPLSSPSIIGHPAWRMDPTYFRSETGEALRVTNLGGRTHTFTEVANFGGGFIPVLNGTLLTAPECSAGPAQIPPGTSVEVNGLSTGNHTFQCCIHPWMRILIKVQAEDEKHEDEKHKD